MSPNWLQTKQVPHSSIWGLWAGGSLGVSLLIASCSSVSLVMFTECPFQGMQEHSQIEITHWLFWNGWPGNLIHSLSGMFSHISKGERRAKWFVAVCLPVTGSKLSPHSLTLFHPHCVPLPLFSPPLPFWGGISLSVFGSLCLWVSLFWGPPVRRPSPTQPIPRCAHGPPGTEGKEGWLWSFLWKQERLSPSLVTCNFGTNYTAHTDFKCFCGAFHVRCSY